MTNEHSTIFGVTRNVVDSVPRLPNTLRFPLLTVLLLFFSATAICQNPPYVDPATHVTQGSGDTPAPPPNYECPGPKTDSVSITEKCSAGEIIVERVWDVTTSYATNTPGTCHFVTERYTQVIHTGRKCSEPMDKKIGAGVWDAWLTLCRWRWLRDHPDWEEKHPELARQWKEGHSEQKAKDKVSE